MTWQKCMVFLGAWWEVDTDPKLKPVSPDHSTMMGGAIALGHLITWVPGPFLLTGEPFPLICSKPWNCEDPCVQTAQLLNSPMLTQFLQLEGSLVSTDSTSGVPVLSCSMSTNIK